MIIIMLLPVQKRRKKITNKLTQAMNLQRFLFPNFFHHLSKSLPFHDIQLIS